MSMSIAAMLEADAITVEELLDARLGLEVRLAGLAAQRATSQQQQEISDATNQARASVARGLDLLDSDARFHRGIAAGSGNRLNLTFTDWVFEVFQPKLIEIVRPVVDNSAIVDQHQAICDAILDRDTRRAERAMEDHLNYLASLVQRLKA
jgi:GntR family transcriptional repressor for pyruvate dehydrogenase complex